MDGLRWRRIGSLQNSAQRGLRYGSLGKALWRRSYWCRGRGGRAMVFVFCDPCSHFTDFGELKVGGVCSGRELQGVPGDVVFVSVSRWADDFALS